MNGFSDGIFHAELRLDGGIRVDARPSDMVRVALTVGAPVHVEAWFRAWLDTARVEDFRAP